MEERLLTLEQIDNAVERRNYLFDLDKKRSFLDSSLERVRNKIVIDRLITKEDN